GPGRPRRAGAGHRAVRAAPGAQRRGAGRRRPVARRGRGGAGGAAGAARLIALNGGHRRQGMQGRSVLRPREILRASEMRPDTTLSAEVIVVGSGPGGATVARELARGGRRVLLL